MPLSRVNFGHICWDTTNWLTHETIACLTRRDATLTSSTENLIYRPLTTRCVLSISPKYNLIAVKIMSNIWQRKSKFSCFVLSFSTGLNEINLNNIFSSRQKKTNRYDKKTTTKTRVTLYCKILTKAITSEPSDEFLWKIPLEHDNNEFNFYFQESVKIYGYSFLLSSKAITRDDKVVTIIDRRLTKYLFFLNTNVKYRNVCNVLPGMASLKLGCLSCATHRQYLKTIF